MKELNYSEAIKLAKELSQDLVNKNKLMSHCKKHDLNYNNVVSFIRGNRKAKQPKLICDVLRSLGYSSTIDKQIIYNFIIDTDQTENLNIDALIKK